MNRKKENILIIVPIGELGRYYEVIYRFTNKDYKYKFFTKALIHHLFDTKNYTKFTVLPIYSEQTHIYHDEFKKNILKLKNDLDNKISISFTPSIIYNIEQLNDQSNFENFLNKTALNINDKKYQIVYFNATHGIKQIIYIFYQILETLETLELVTFSNIAFSNSNRNKKNKESLLIATVTLTQYDHELKNFIQALTIFKQTGYLTSLIESIRIISEKRQALSIYKEYEQKLKTVDLAIKLGLTQKLPIYFKNLYEILEDFQSRIQIFNILLKKINEEIKSFILTNEDCIKEQLDKQIKIIKDFYIKKSQKTFVYLGLRELMLSLFIFLSEKKPDISILRDKQKRENLSTLFTSISNTLEKERKNLYFFDETLSKEKFLENFDIFEKKVLQDVEQNERFKNKYYDANKAKEHINVILNFIKNYKKQKQFINFINDWIRIREIRNSIAHTGYNNIDINNFIKTDENLINIIKNIENLFIIAKNIK